MLVAHGLVRGGSLRDQALLQPVQCGRHSRVLIPQALDELDCKCRREGRAVAADQCVWLGGTAVNAQKSIGKGVCFLARGTTAHDARRGAAKILQKYDSQRNRDRPKLADGQWLNALIGAYESAQRFTVEAAVGVGNECPGDTEYAWIPV